MPKILNYNFIYIFLKFSGLFQDIFIVFFSPGLFQNIFTIFFSPGLLQAWKFIISFSRFSRVRGKPCISSCVAVPKWFVG